MTKYHSNDDKIRILTQLKMTPKDMSLDTFCAESGISRRTLSRWAKSDATPFNIGKRRWERGINPKSLANLSKGDQGKSLARIHGARAFVEGGYLS